MANENAVTPTEVKPKSKKKLIVICCACLAVVLAAVAVVCFVVLPANNNNMQKNITLKFDEKMLYDGKLSAKAMIDTEKWANGDSNKKETLDELVGYCKLSAMTDGSEGMETANLTNLKSDDSVTVTLKWDKDSKVDELAKKAGVSVDKSDKSYTVKVADQLKAQDLEAGKCLTVDMLGKITDDNGTNHIKSVGTSFSIDFYVEDFSFKDDNGNTYTYTDKDRKFVVTDNSGKEAASIDLYFISQSQYYDKNEEKEFSVVARNTSGQIGETNIFLERTSIKTKLPEPVALNAESAKEGIDTLKSFITSSDGDNKPEAEEVYFLKNKDTSSHSENVIVTICKQADGKYVSKTYVNSYYYEGSFITELQDNDGVEAVSSKSDAVKANKYLSDKNFEQTKILG